MTNEIKAKHQLVIDMFKRGCSRKEIEDATGYEYQYISKILSKNKLTPRRYVRDYGKKIRELHSQGKNLSQIAKEVGFSRDNVKIWMMKNGLYEQKIFYKTKEQKEQEIEEAISTLRAVERPKIKKYEYKGKKYLDVTGIYTGG